jgi:hypothetical protein
MALAKVLANLELNYFEANFNIKVLLKGDVRICRLSSTYDTATSIEHTQPNVGLK